MFDVLRFWLARGVDGFRVDVLWMMIKDDQFRDNPPNPARDRQRPLHDRCCRVYTEDRPEMAELVAAMRAVLDAFGDRVLIGEIYLPVERLVAYYGRDGRGAQLPFNFQLLTMQGWDAATLAGIITRYEAALPPGAWPNWVLGNHDRPRIASRVGPAQARVAAVLLLTLRGTPTIYMGDELGMADTPIPPDEVQDPAELRQPGRAGPRPGTHPVPMAGRPGRRLHHRHAVAADRRRRAAERAADDPASMASLYRGLLALRRQHPALGVGHHRRRGARTARCCPTAGGRRARACWCWRTRRHAPCDGAGADGHDPAVQHGGRAGQATRRAGRAAAGRGGGGAGVRASAWQRVRSNGACARPQPGRACAR